MASCWLGKIPTYPYLPRDRPREHEGPVAWAARWREGQCLGRHRGRARIRRGADQNGARVSRRQSSPTAPHEVRQ